MRFRAALSTVLLAAYLPACTSYQATTESVLALTAPPKPVGSVRVTTTEGRTLEVQHPRVSGDSLHGTALTIGSRGQPSSEQVAIPVKAIKTVEVRRTDESRTMVLGIVVGAVVVASILAMNSSEY